MFFIESHELNNVNILWMNNLTLQIFTIVFVALSIFLITEFLHRKKLAHSEINRKIIHIFGGFIASILPLILPRWIVIFLMLVATLIILIEKKINFLPALHSVIRRTSGEVLFPLGIALIILIEPQAWKITYGILIMGVSDAMASIIGIKWGKKKYSTFGKHTKTYIGSFTFFICTFAIGVTGLIIGEDFIISQTLLPATLSAIILTLVEAGSSNGLDNLLLPISATLIMRILV